jgi:hypothetical protein
MDAMSYETFIRRAFSLNERELIERWGDPASLANTDSFTENNISSVKAAVAYGIEIFNGKILNHNSASMSEAEMIRVESFTGQIINAANLQDLSLIADDYITTVEDKYYDRKDGKETLK